MYQSGEVVLYGNMGVCRIVDISEQSLQGAGRRLYYTLSPLYQECVIYAPVEEGKVFMRRVIPRDEAERLIDLIPSIQAEPYHNKAVGQLSEHYMASLETHDCADLIELTMSIYAKKLEVEGRKRKFSAVDERFMRRAEDLLFGELSVALEIPKEQVPVYIADRVGQLTDKAGGAKT